MSEEDKGQPDPGGMRLTLRDASGQVIATVGSAADGVYSFNDLLNSPPPAAPPARITGSVYLDANRDGRRGPGEPGYAGVAVLLTGTDAAGKAIRKQATTDADGRYQFDDLAPGYYRLETLTPIPHTQPGKNHIGTLGGQDSAGAMLLAIQAGQKGERYDFARVLPAQPEAPRPAATPQTPITARDLFFSVLGMESFGPAVFGGTQLGTGPVELPTVEAMSTISGCVFHDRDNDGALGPVDSGLVGVEVTVEGVSQKGKPVRKTVLTGEDGSFTIGELPPGTYRLSRKLSGAYVAGRPVPGMVNGTTIGQPGEDGIRGIVLAAGAFGQNYRFAEIRGCGLTGMVTAEDALDDDGPQESALEGVTVILTGTDDAGRGVQLTAKTDGRGLYRFKDLFPGTYDVYASPLKGWAAKEARAGDKGGRASGAGKVAAVSLRPGDLGTRYNFKMQSTASLAGRVWSNARAGPIARANVRVTLTGQDEAGNEVCRTVATDEQGGYRFVALRSGLYRVEAAVPGGNRQWTARAGTSRGTARSNSDQPPAVDEVALGAGVSATGYDFQSGEDSVGSEPRT